MRSLLRAVYTCRGCLSPLRQVYYGFTLLSLYTAKACAQLPPAPLPSKYTNLETGPGNGRRHHLHDGLAGVRDHGALLAIPSPVVPP